MATLTATRAASTFPVYKPMGAGQACIAWGTYDVATNPTAGDILDICKIPAGAVVVGGWLMGDDLDTNATETIDIDIGWRANGVEAADPDGFGNLGVITGDAFAAGNASMEAGMFYMLMGNTGSLLRPDGPKSFTNETTLTITFTAAAATLTAGTVSLVVLYVVP